RVSTSEQIKRIVPVIENLSAKNVFVSVDTRDAVVAEAAIDAGAAIVNDVSGLSDERMASVVASCGVSLILMHAKGNPKSMQNDPSYNDVVTEVNDYLQDRISVAESAGIAPCQIAVDVGIGFGKRHQDNLDLLKHTSRFLTIRKPMMIGVSRKSFLGRTGSGKSPEDRLAGSIAASVLAYERGARLFRTHDVEETRHALNCAQAVLDIQNASITDTSVN
ncbi:MAG: dihydropteroate synthase, partial [Candidatus Lindowbacteria bacterium]|nr:dihydropteroate synthase [Candidatus Lindowbacteria bacterium]